VDPPPPASGDISAKGAARLDRVRRNSAPDAQRASWCCSTVPDR
jgi:hypothetical protein